MRICNGVVRLHKRRELGKNISRCQDAEYLDSDFPPDNDDEKVTCGACLRIIRSAKGIAPYSPKRMRR